MKCLLRYELTFIPKDISNILVIYFVKSNIYDAMARVKEEINVQIMEIVEQNNCQFAYPTQTVFLGK
jgi:MscS family membrane protein